MTSDEELIERLRRAAKPSEYRKANPGLGDTAMAVGYAYNGWLLTEAADRLEAAQKAIAEREAEIDRLRHDLERSMKAHSEAETHIERLEKAIRLLLDCPDIADNDHKDEETHAAERFARAALHSEQEQSE